MLTVHKNKILRGKNVMMIGLIILLFLIYVPALLYLKFGWFKNFYHNILKWHRPSEKMDFDGCSLHTVCKHCSKEIMQDSQGNWFEI